MGYIDWLSTIIGIAYFGAAEGNPLLAELTRTNLVAFTALKLSTAIFVGLLAYLGERMLQRLKDNNSKSFLRARITLRAGYIIATTVLLVTILNNLVIVAKTI
jgi:hypothetical protein